MSERVLTVALKYEDDVVIARQRARQLARLLGFDAQDQTRIATSVSEIARNAFRYAGGGMVEFGVEGRTAPELLEVVVSDRGPGIRDVSRILEGRAPGSHPFTLLDYFSSDFVVFIDESHQTVPQIGGM